MNKMKWDFNIQTSPREWPEHANGVLVKSSKLLSIISMLLYFSIFVSRVTLNHTDIQ